MLKLSTKSRYALRAMIELALREGEGPVQLRELARAQQLSAKYLEQLVIPLRHAGLVQAARGPAGGYVLARPAEGISALEVVEAVEGPVCLLDCVARRDLCERSDVCAARGLWAGVREAVRGVLAQHSLAALRERQRAAGARGAWCYEI